MEITNSEQWASYVTSSINRGELVIGNCYLFNIIIVVHKLM